LALPLLSGCSPTLVRLLTLTPGTFVQRDEQTLVFTGYITFGTANAFAAALKPETTTLVLDSGGGLTTDGLEMGRLIHTRGLDVVVDGLCASSCANYLFTAGRHKTVLPGSYVGFHGDPRASRAGDDELARARGEVVPVRLGNPEQYRADDEFYRSIGLNPAIFSQSVQFTNRYDVTFWAPSPGELRCLGVKDLSMWFSTNPRDYSRYKDRSVSTSVQEGWIPDSPLCSTTARTP
jgi:hypothetical protein